MNYPQKDNPKEQIAVTFRININLKPNYSYFVFVYGEDSSNRLHFVRQHVNKNRQVNTDPAIDIIL